MLISLFALVGVAIKHPKKKLQERSHHIFIKKKKQMKTSSPNLALVLTLIKPLDSRKQAQKIPLSEFIWVFTTRNRNVAAALIFFLFLLFFFVCKQKNNEHMFERLPTVLLHAQVHSTAINPTTRGSVRVLQASGARSCDVATSVRRVCDVRSSFAPDCFCGIFLRILLDERKNGVQKNRQNVDSSFFVETKKDFALDAALQFWFLRFFLKLFAMNFATIQFLCNFQQNE